MSHNEVSSSRFSVHRELTGSPVTSDASTPYASVPAINVSTSPFESVSAHVRLSGGTNPTAVLEFWGYDNAIWYRIATTSALSDGDTATATTWGKRLWVRVKTLTGNPTGLTIYLMGNEV